MSRGPRRTRSRGSSRGVPLVTPPDGGTRHIGLVGEASGTPAAPIPGPCDTCHTRTHTLLRGRHPVRTRGKGEGATRDSVMRSRCHKRHVADRCSNLGLFRASHRVSQHQRVTPAGSRILVDATGYPEQEASRSEPSPNGSFGEQGTDEEAGRRQLAALIGEIAADSTGDVRRGTPMGRDIPGR
jgi:hypothetical protein